MINEKNKNKLQDQIVELQFLVSELSGFAVVEPNRKDMEILSMIVRLVNNIKI